MTFQKSLNVLWNKKVHGSTKTAKTTTRRTKEALVNSCRAQKN